MVNGEQTNFKYRLPAFSNHELRVAVGDKPVRQVNSTKTY